MSEHKSIGDFLLDISTNLFMETDSYGKISYANTKANLAFSIPSNKDVSLDNVFDKASTMLLYSHLKNILYQNYADNFQFEYQRRFYNVFAYPRQNKVVFCFNDITEYRHLSHRLHHIKQRLEFAERTAQMGYWELDLEHRRFYWSAEMYRIFGAETQQISSKKNLIREQVFFEDLPLYKQKLTQLLKKRENVEGQVRIRRVDNNETVYCQFKAGIMTYQKQSRIAGTFQNITPLINIQKQLEEARRRADKLNMDKSYFLAQASHDLRQPLQALNLFASLLEDETDVEEQKKIALKIKASCDNLNTLLTNLLDISKLDAGGMTFEKERFSLKELLLKLEQEYTLIAEEKGIKFKVKAADIIIDSDAVLIERVVRNFLSNAFKYAKNKVSLSCFQYGHKIVIRVLDNGIGIKEEEIDCIFEDFYQCRGDNSNRQNGAGLGLSIVKKIAGLLDGRVSVSSRPGCYTSFKLVLHP